MLLNYCFCCSLLKSFLFCLIFRLGVWLRVWKIRLTTFLIWYIYCHYISTEHLRKRYKDLNVLQEKIQINAISIKVIIICINISDFIFDHSIILNTSQLNINRLIIILHLFQFTCNVGFFTQSNALIQSLISLITSNKKL